MNKKQLLAAIGLLALSGTVGSASAAPGKQLAANPFQRCEAVKGSRLAQADCACDTALSDGSARTLQLFIDKYAKEAPSTACGALGLTLSLPPTVTGHGGTANSYN